jgi:alanine-glyoxylate transaminase/serine-glyoxylate transaminase/serine-pyruvate transaminase
VRKALDQTGHPALLMVDTISSLGSVDYRHDEWGVDVSIGGSQKGLMLPPGLSFNAVSAKALAASKTAKMPRAFWSWDDMLEANKTGYFPYTPATNLLFGLREAIAMLHEEGLPNVYARHIRHGEATRRAARAWGLELVCENPADYSPVLTAVMMPAVSILRMRQLRLSATKRLPDASEARPCGVLRVALLAAASSPVEPAVPVPAMMRI